MEASMRSLGRLAFALTFVAPALPAQPPVIPTWPVASESRVRVLSPVLGDKKQVGVAVAATRDTLSFRGEKQLSYVSIHTSDIRQLEISQGKHTRLAKGALLGGLIGAATGAALGVAFKINGSHECDSCVLTTSPAWDALYGAILGGIPGTVVGMFVMGGRRWDTWVPVAVPSR
jgi:hypothetical protein